MKAKAKITQFDGYTYRKEGAELAQGTIPPMPKGRGFLA